MEFEIINFFFVMIGASVMLIFIALIVYWRKARRRSMITNPHKDHLYRYSSPSITDVPADYYTHRHHRRQPSDSERR